jgi:hypothetical protein
MDLIESKNLEIKLKHSKQVEKDDGASKCNQLG